MFFVGRGWVALGYIGGVFREDRNVGGSIGFGIIVINQRVGYRVTIFSIHRIKFYLSGLFY